MWQRAHCAFCRPPVASICVLPRLNASWAHHQHGHRHAHWHCSSVCCEWHVALRGQIFTRMFRVYGHMYHTHFKQVRVGRAIAHAAPTFSRPGVESLADHCGAAADSAQLRSRFSTWVVGLLCLLWQLVQMELDTNLNRSRRDESCHKFIATRMTTPRCLPLASSALLCHRWSCCVGVRSHSMTGHYAAWTHNTAAFCLLGFGQLLHTVHFVLP